MAERRLYSYRYPFDITSAMEPWRDVLGASFDEVVTRLHDRDKAIEDHLSLGVGQGYLGTGFPSAPPVALTGTPTDIPGMSVTFTLPAVRRLKVTAYVHITNLDASPRASFIEVLDEDNNILFTDSANHDSFGGSLGPGRTLHAISFQTDVVGQHTYRLKASINGASGSLVSVAGGNESFLSVEDVGPPLT